MKGPAVDQLVYEFMFPKPKTTDPQNFQGFLQRQLVPEVRMETQAFYGHLSSQEAKYPGLDYSYKPHRVRLSRFPWHRRLFRAFDAVGLTRHEIASLTKWEGTRWAKERFEREHGIVIRDTTSDGIFDWVPPHLRVAVAPQAHRLDVEHVEDCREDETEDNEAENEMDEDLDDSDAEIQSVGVALNEQLRANAALREAGRDIVMDEAWEQWLKDAAENGIPYLRAELSPDANIPGTRPAAGEIDTPSRYLNAARLGRWAEIPEPLHNVFRQHIAESNRRMAEAQMGPSTSTHGLRNTRSLFVFRPSASTSSTSPQSSRAAPSSASTVSSHFPSRLNLSSRATVVPPATHQARAYSRSVTLQRQGVDAGSIPRTGTFPRRDNQPRTNS